MIFIEENNYYDDDVLLMYEKIFGIESEVKIDNNIIIDKNSNDNIIIDNNNDNIKNISNNTYNICENQIIILYITKNKNVKYNITFEKKYINKDTNYFFWEAIIYINNDIYIGKGNNKKVAKLCASINCIKNNIYINRFAEAYLSK